MVVQARSTARHCARSPQHREGDLAAGTLVRLFDVAFRAGSYYLVRPMRLRRESACVPRVEFAEKKRKR
jgi:hypothetical protein